MPRPLYPPGKNTVPMELEAGRAPMSVGTLWRIEKYPLPCIPVAVPTMLLWPNKLLVL